MAGGQKADRLENPPREQVLALVAQIFTRLEAIFPRTFSSAFPSADMMTLARRELAQEVASWPALPTRRVVERAMSDLKREGSTWPPAIPALVSMLAPTPEDFGMPATGDAWCEALAHAHEPNRHRWSHEAVHMAGNATGWWDLTHTTAKSQWPRLEKRFHKHYAALANRVMAGEDLVPRQLLEHDSHRTPAELAERAGQEEAQRRAEAAGLPHRMNSDQGLRSLRAALKA
nr:replication protein P [Halomonas sp.]